MMGRPQPNLILQASQYCRPLEQRLDGRLLTAGGQQVSHDPRKPEDIVCLHSRAPCECSEASLRPQALSKPTLGK
jgi:hypothetical protein